MLHAGVARREPEHAHGGRSAPGWVGKPEKIPESSANLFPIADVYRVRHHLTFSGGGVTIECEACGKTHPLVSSLKTIRALVAFLPSQSRTPCMERVLPWVPQRSPLPACLPTSAVATSAIVLCANRLQPATGPVRRPPRAICPFPSLGFAIVHGETPLACLAQFAWLGEARDQARWLLKRLGGQLSSALPNMSGILPNTSGVLSPAWCPARRGSQAAGRPQTGARRFHG